MNEEYTTRQEGAAWLVVSPRGVIVFRVPDEDTARDLAWVLNNARLERPDT